MRLTAVLTPAIAVAALLIPFTALQPASAAQDASHPADANLWAPSPTCSASECWWDFPESSLGYYFSRMFDAPNRESIFELEVQSVASTTSSSPSGSTQEWPAQNWRVQMNDPSAFTVIDFYNGIPRFWIGQDIALQADPSILGGVAYNPQLAHNLRSGTVDASATGPLARIHQIFTPQVSTTVLTAVSQTDIANFGADISAVGRIEFSEPVTELQLGDIVPTPDSTGCRVESILDGGGGLVFDVVVRGCTSLSLNLVLVANSVLGNAPGPISDTYWMPIQPYVPAEILAPPLPVGGSQPPSGGAGPAPEPAPTGTATPEPSPSATQSVLPIQSVTPAPALPMAQPVAEEPNLEEPIREEPVQSESVQVEPVPPAPVHFASARQIPTPAVSPPAVSTKAEQPAAPHRVVSRPEVA
ncbi:MAG: hypothetical protein KGL41_01990, partial [Actinomycetales bacterium]|nr:hypothetical protein [Actinomycetales bacterium]